MLWQIITITITAYLSTDHPNYICFLTTESNSKHETKVVDINTANRTMWELKRKGWETKTITSYNPYSPRVFTREVRWLHLDLGYRED